MISLLLLLTIIYAGGLIIIALGVNRLKPLEAGEAYPFVSVIVAARNEADNISHLLEALGSQHYPPDLHEIVIIDDASSDGTAEKIEEWIASRPQLAIRLIRSQGRNMVKSPKKHALAQGIAAAHGEILLFTDADCQPPPSWILSLQSCIQKDIGMVIGYSPYEIPRPRTVGQHFLALESLSLAALAAGTTGWGRPATCTGRNLGYRKSVWVEVHGFDPIATFISGDDDLFLKLVLEGTHWRVVYALTPEAVVPTRLLSSARAFFRQRVRHASKGFYYGWKMSAILALAWLFNLLLFATALWSLFSSVPGAWPWIAWLVKSAAELLLLIRFARPMQRLRTLALFPLAEFAHVLYVILFGALGPLTRVHWKEKALSLESIHS